MAKSITLSSRNISYGFFANCYNKCRIFERLYAFVATTDDKTSLLRHTYENFIKLAWSVESAVKKWQLRRFGLHSVTSIRKQKPMDSSHEQLYCQLQPTSDQQNGVDIQWSGERSLTWVKSTLTHIVFSYKKGGLRENFMHQTTYQEVQDHP